VVEELTCGGRRQRRGCRTAAALLLGRPGPAAGLGSAKFAGNGRQPRSSACSGELNGENENGAEVVWEVAGNGVSSMEGSRALTRV
jgi:hypothetical protein